MDLPIVCTLTSGELQQRKASLLPGVLARASHLEVLTDGYRARFSASDEVVRDLAAMIDAERQCCRFLRFQLTIEPDEGPVVLDVTGPPGTRDFLAAILDPSA
jgi:hypothetical protein